MIRSIDAPWDVDNVIYLDCYNPNKQSIAYCRINGLDKFDVYFSDGSNFIDKIGKITGFGRVAIYFDSGIRIIYWFKGGVYHRDDGPANTTMYPTGLCSFTWYNEGIHFAAAGGDLKTHKMHNHFDSKPLLDSFQNLLSDFNYYYWI